MLRGALLALPVVVVLGALLASADAVFASIFSVDIEISGWWQHVALVAIGAVLAAVFFIEAEQPRTGTPSALGITLGIEAVIVLAAVSALFGAFALSQLAVAAKGPSYVLETTGLTAAEYARSGFFQLLWVATIVLVVVLGLRAVVDLSDRWTRIGFVVFGELTILLTLVIVAVAIVRLGLYADSFGLTMLRLTCTVVAWWIGLVLLIVGAALTSPRGRGTWLAPAVACSALVVLFGYSVSNPERVVVEHNLAHYESSEEFDLGYALHLSDDAVPALLDGLDFVGLGPLDLSGLCESPPDRGLADANLSASASADALAAICDAD